MTTAKTKGPLVSYTLATKQVVPAILIEESKDGACLFIIDPVGPHVAYDVPKGSKPGTWK